MKNDANRVKAVVAMSGGVDSSVAAALLNEHGYQVIGVTMKIWDGEHFPIKETRHACYGPDEEEDIKDARRVAQILGIDFHVFNLRQEYKAEVLDYFFQEYLSGRTPNPCLRCNRKVKFDALVKKVRDSGIEFDYFATGHYARVEYSSRRQRYLLKKAGDSSKDQSYFLSFLSQDQLGQALFPLGDYSKGEVRKIASGLGLGIEDKPDSQNFIAGGYSSLLGVVQTGPILNKQGDVIGENRGIPFYTIGQRKGLGISAKEPLYVTDIDPEKNAIIVGSKEEVYQDEFITSSLNWIAVEELTRTIEVMAKIRYLHDEAEAIIRPLNGDRVHVKFKEPQMAITPGQAGVFYHEDVVIGGGTIEKQGSKRMARIIAVCSSESKGTPKDNITTGVIREDYGLVGDAHADCTTNRQVSLLAIESMNKMKDLGIDLVPGLFAENLTTEGIDLLSIPIGTKVSVGGEVVLAISQIGKECHTGCAIFQQVGKCIMPKEGVFATVVHGGTVTVGDEIRIKKDGE